MIEASFVDDFSIILFILKILLDPPPFSRLSSGCPSERPLIVILKICEKKAVETPLKPRSRSAPTPGPGAKRGQPGIEPGSPRGAGLVPAGVAADLLALVRDFLRDSESAGRSRHTVRNYRSDLLRFCRFVQDRDEVDTTRTVDLLRAYLSTLDGRKATTRARHFAALRSFFNWCYRHDLVPANPMAKFDPPKTPVALPRPIPNTDHERLMRIIGQAEPRERLLFTLVAETGLRIEEALSIYVEDLTLSPGQDGIRIRGKGGLQRDIPLPFEFKCLNLLKRYLREEGLTAGPVFRTGKENARRMTYGAALYQWGLICREAGVHYEIHQLRHSTATQMLNDGVGIGTVRRLLGHKNLQTTQRYAALEDATVRKELEGWARRRKR